MDILRNYLVLLGQFWNKALNLKGILWWDSAVLQNLFKSHFL
jgi:hypothetical protein